MASINIITSLLGEQMTLPGGVWESIISWIYGFIGNYGFTILILSVVLKLLMLPIDYFQRKSTIKNARVQERLNPQLEALKEKYKNDKNTFNQKQMELYKRENYNIFGSCGIMLLYLVVTLVVFVTLFNAMNNITNTMVKEQYQQLKTVYTETVGDETAKNQAVLNRYNEIKVDWLWVENLWRADTIASPIASFEDYQNVAKIAEAEVASAKAEYETIMNPLRQSVRSINGYYILIILAAITSFLSAMIGQITQKKKQRKAESDPGRILNAEGKREKPVANQSTAKVGKIMMFALPVIMVLITLNYCAAFAIYIVTISFVSMLSTLLFNKIISNSDDNKKTKIQNERKLLNRPEYSR